MTSTRPIYCITDYLLSHCLVAFSKNPNLLLAICSATTHCHLISALTQLNKNVIYVCLSLSFSPCSAGKSACKDTQLTPSGYTIWHVCLILEWCSTMRLFECKPFLKNITCTRSCTLSEPFILCLHSVGILIAVTFFIKLWITCYQCRRFTKALKCLNNFTEASGKTARPR